MVKKPSHDWLKQTAQRVTRAHFAYLAAYLATIIIFDAWNLITRASVGQRWSAAGVLLVINTVIWYASHMRTLQASTYKWLVVGLASADVIFASLNVYWERGMASKSVALFLVPLITVAVLRSRMLLVSAATVCAAAYSTTIVRYFNDNYGEGFRVELWGNVFFYSAMFFVVAWLLYTVVRSSTPSRS